MYLQLAEKNTYSHLAQSPNELYVFVPQGFRGSEKDMYIREDILDDLPEAQFQQLMFELAPYQGQGLSGKADRQQRRADRRAKKATKGGGARRAARQLRVEARQKGKVDKASAKAAGGGKFGSFIDKAGDVVGGIFSGGHDYGADAAQKDLDISMDPSGFNVDYNNNDGEPSFFERNKVPLIIGGVVLAGGAIYLATRKK